MGIVAVVVSKHHIGRNIWSIKGRNVRIAGGMNVTSTNNHQFYPLIGLGVILGCFLNLVVFLYFGENALWWLSVFGVCVLVLFFLQKVKQPAVKKEPVDNEPKTLRSRMRVWTK